MSELNRGRLLIALAGILWSLGGVFAKEVSIPGSSQAFYRSLIAGLFLIPFAPRGSRVVRPAMVPFALVFGAMTGLYLASATTTTAANAIFLQCSAVFWTIPIAAAWLREPVDRRSVAGVAVALVGVVLIVARGRDGRPGEATGILLGLASGVAYAAVVVGLRRFRDVDATWLTSFVNLGGSLALGLYLAATGAGPVVPEPGQWPVLVAFGVVQMAIPYVLFARGLRVVRAPAAALLSLLEPAFNPLWVWLRHGESPAGPTVVGGLILLLGVAVRYVPWHAPGDRPADVLKSREDS